MNWVTHFWHRPKSLSIWIPPVMINSMCSPFIIILTSHAITSIYTRLKKLFLWLHDAPVTTHRLSITTNCLWLSDMLQILTCVIMTGGKNSSHASMHFMRPEARAQRAATLCTQPYNAGYRQPRFARRTISPIVVHFRLHTWRKKLLFNLFHPFCPIF